MSTPMHIPKGKIVLTYEDYVLLPNDRNRYEILEGELTVTPAPSTKHQSASANLFKLLRQGNLTAAYITFNLDGNVSYATALTAADMSKLLKVMNGITLVASCTTNNTDLCHTRPIVTCENQEDRAVVVYVKESHEAGISMQKNCLTVQGKDETLVKAYTKLLFILYNII